MAQLTHGNEFQDTLFDILQAVVVMIQNVTTLGQIFAILRIFSPWKGCQGIQIGAGYI